MSIDRALTSPRYGIVGDGRIARHIACYFSFLQIPFRQWSRRTGQNPEQFLSGCEVVLLLISDGAIEGFVREHFSKRSHTLVHCSGALTTSLAQGVHPLMTFGDELLSLEQYAAIPVITEKGGRPFAEIFPELKNPSYEIPKESKAFYHSLCVMSGNFSVILWQKLFREFHDTLHLPESAAVPYLRQVFRSIERDPATALTGPLQRRDGATVARNLAALRGDPFARVYRAFVLASRDG